MCRPQRRMSSLPEHILVDDRQAADGVRSIADQRMRAGPPNPDGDDIPDRLTPGLGEVDHPVVLPPALPIRRTPAAVTIHEDPHGAADQAFVELQRNPIGEVEEPVEALLFGVLGDLSVVPRCRCARTRRECEREDLSKTDLLEELQGLAEIVVGFSGETDNHVGGTLRSFTAERKRSIKSTN